MARRMRRRNLPLDLKKRVLYGKTYRVAGVSPISIVIIACLIVAFFSKLEKVRRHHSKTLKALFPEQDSEQYRIRPLSCHDFMKSTSAADGNNNKLQLHDRIKDPNRGEILLVRNATDEFLVSIHKRTADNHLKGYTILQTGTFYPTKMTELMKQVLLKKVELNNSTSIMHEEGPRRFMEVGASFGWFSLLARKLGVQHVDVFEPNLVNVRRICQSVDANRWWNSKNDSTSSSIDIYPYGITAEDGSVLFQYHEDGTARINDNWGHKSQAFALDSSARERGWLERNDQDIAILKIDVGTHAPLVIAGASELLSSGMVKALIFDLTVRRMGDKERCIQAIQQLMTSGFEFKMWGADQRGPSNPSVWPHDDDLPSKIVKAMQRPKQHFEMSLYWKYKEV